MPFTCWITTATNTHSKYVIIIVFPDNEDYAKAPQSYVTRAMSVTVIFNFSGNSLIQKHWLTKVHKKYFTRRYGGKKTCSEHEKVINRSRNIMHD